MSLIFQQLSKFSGALVGAPLPSVIDFQLVGESRSESLQKVPRKIKEENEEFPVFLYLITELLSSCFLKICKMEDVMFFFLPIQFSLLIYPEGVKSLLRNDVLLIDMGNMVSRSQ